MAKKSTKVLARIRRKKHIRKSIVGTLECPRLSVFRSAKHIYAQLIVDESDKGSFTLASANTLMKSLSISNGGNVEAAAKVGAQIAQLASEKSISSVVFDRNGYLYHGRVKALADAAREGGLQF